MIARAPGETLLLGSLPRMKRDPLGHLASCRTRGDVVRLRFAHRTAYLVNHPDLVESVLVKSSSALRKTTGREPSALSRLLSGNELVDRVVHFPADDEFWSRERHLVQPAFRRGRIEWYAATMAASARRLADAWRDGETRDIHADMMRLNLEVVAQTIFHADASEDVDTVVRAFDVIMGEIAARMGNPLQIPPVVPTRRNRRFLRAVTELDLFFDRISARQHAPPDAYNLLAVLEHAHDGRGRAAREVHRRYQLMTLMIAGYETTALSLTWSWYLLAHNPSAREQLARELEDVIGDRLPTAADAPRLRYTEAVLKEALRLYPPVWLFGARVAVRDCELAGRRIRRGALLLVSPWATQRDGRFFAEPEQFRPERWNGDGQPLPRWAYFPFSGGPRHCLGHAYATMEAVLTLATIAQRFEVEPAPGPDVELEPLITLRPKGGLPLVVRRRPGAAEH